MTPLPIAWMTVQDADSKVTWECASAFYNAVSGGVLTAVAVGFEDGAIAGLIRKTGEVVVHTATFPNRRRIHKLLAEGPVKISDSELCSAVGVSCGRIAAAPVAFSGKVIKEMPLGNGRVAFFFNAVGVHVSKSIVVGGKIDAQALQAIACTDNGRLMIAARELHTMVFPSQKDAEGRWIIPRSEPTPPREGGFAEKDLSYVPPQLPALQFNPLKALIVPRPIGWISTRGPSGDNLSPYSFLDIFLLMLSTME